MLASILAFPQNDAKEAGACSHRPSASVREERYSLLINGRYSPPSTMTTVAVAVPLAVIVGVVASAVSVGAVDAHSLARGIVHCVGHGIGGAEGVALGARSFTVSRRKPRCKRWSLCRFSGALPVLVTVWQKATASPL